MLRLSLLPTPTPQLPRVTAARRVAAAAAAAIPHAIAAAVVLTAASVETAHHPTSAMATAAAMAPEATAIVFLPPANAAGRGGGGGGNGQAGPIRKASGIGHDAATLRTRRQPAPPPATSTPTGAAAEDELPAVVLDAKPLASGWFEQTGLVSSGPIDSTSTGEGSGGGVGTGVGTGIGPGRGPGFGPGEGGGTGGGVYQPGGAVTAPRVVSEVLPVYPADALARNIAGRVRLSIVVRHDGRASDIRIVRSLDPELDAAAIQAVLQWRFEPGRLGAVAVDVMAIVDVDFSIR